MKDFIFSGEYVINPAHISFIRYHPDGSVGVAVGTNHLTFEGDDAKVFQDMRPVPPQASDTAAKDTQKIEKPKH
jgi:hypothetical protein